MNTSSIRGRGEEPTDGIVDVDLDAVDVHGVWIVVDDATGSIVKASSD